MLRYTVLHCTTSHCHALHCTALLCTALYCANLHCTVLHYTVLHRTAHRHCMLQFPCTLLDAHAVPTAKLRSFVLEHTSVFPFRFFLSSPTWTVHSHQNILARHAILGMKSVPLIGSTFSPLIPSNMSILFLKFEGLCVVSVTLRLLYV